MADESTRRSEAAALAEELLGDIELDRIDPVAVARKAGRLARLLDDGEAMEWLSFETGSYPDGALDASAWKAATLSGRLEEGPNGGDPTATVMSLGQLAVGIEALKLDLSRDSGGTSSSDFAITVERENAKRRANLRTAIASRRSILDRVVGSIHGYVVERHEELRFGSAVETAFNVVRSEVDGAIAELVPDALPMISAAFENASSENPEHWQNAAGTCRRLLMTAADRLRPPGPDVKGRKMGQGNYVNRLVDWIVQQGTSDTASAMISSDLEYLGQRLDAADSAGQKGAHVGASQVDRFDASRFVAGTYLVLGDVLRIRTASTE